MRWSFPLVKFGLIGIAGFVSFSSLLEAVGSEATHKQARSIAPAVDGRPVKLETFCVGPDNNLWMACAGSANYPGAIMIYTGEGTLVKSIPLSFLPQAINFSPGGSLFVAGSGKIARLSEKGKVEIEIDAPNIGDKDELVRSMKEQAENRRKQMEAAMASQTKKLQEQIEKFQEVPDDETETAKARRERRLKLLKVTIEQFKENAEQTEASMVVDDSILSRLASSTGITATDDDVFVACPKTQGYGYGIWRMSHELKEPKLVVSDVSGCCGQLDIQTDGEHLIIAENTKFEVGYYDRDGKRLHGWGKRVGKDEDGWGSCCNPMNVRCCANGEVLTAESSIGNIKRYSPTGEYLGLVGKAKVAGGCKHVAIGFDSDRDWHYMMNEDRSHVAVLVPKDQAPAETEDERISREAMSSMGKFLFGTWEIQSTKSETKLMEGMESMSAYILNGFGHMEFSPDGHLVKGAKRVATKGVKETEAPASKSLFGALLSAVTGSSEQAEQMLIGGQSKWQAIQAKGGKFDIITSDDNVPGFGASVEFTGNDEAKFSFFYGDPTAPSYGTFVYKRTSLEACGKDCASSCEKK